jgi:hypothetical protein
MKRFRFTLLALCLVLTYLGWTDVNLFFHNRTAHKVTIEELEKGEIPGQWLNVTDGYLDLEHAVSTSGSIELEALLVPLVSAPGKTPIGVMVETRDPHLLEVFKKYNFQFDSVFEKDKYLRDHEADFHGRRDFTGMVITGLIASGNRDKLLKLSREVGLNVPENVLFISEGKEPPTYRGFFFLGVGLLGLFRVLTTWRKNPTASRNG